MLLRSTKSYGTDKIKIVVYGQSGVGKTTLATTTSESTLILSAESGLLSVADFDIDYFDLTIDDNGNKIATSTEKVARLNEAALFLQTEEARAKYKWVIIDSLTEIGQLVFESIKESDPKFKDAKHNLPLWGLYGEKIRALIKFFRDLPGFNVVFTALAKADKDEMNRRIMAVDLQGRISEALLGLFDEVFYYEVTDSEEIGQKMRRLVTQPSDKFLAKDRSGKLDLFEKPNLGEIAKKIRGGNHVI